MDARRLRAGEWLAGLSGAALLASLFLPWYGDSLSGWAALSVIDVVLASIAAWAVALVPITAGQGVPAVPLTLETLLALAALPAIALVLFRLADPPSGADGREWGLWLALAGAAGIFAGAVVAIRDERLSPPGRHTDATGHPVPPPAEIEPIPAARLEGPDR
jgi:hypothetical protein